MLENGPDFGGFRHGCRSWDLIVVVSGLRFLAVLDLASGYLGSGVQALGSSCTFEKWFFAFLKEKVIFMNLKIDFLLITKRFFVDFVF